MPRANRHFIPGHIWHITHRCHKQDFLLKFAKDRRNWIHWLFEAKKRYGLCVLNYIVTSNHIHLLVADTGDNCIPKSMQLIASRCAQTYNRRKQRKGAYWEDRYHATAIENNEHMIRCLVYIDLNMVRAGVVQHPSQWLFGGYTEIQNPPVRKRIIDIERLMKLCGADETEEFQKAHCDWVESKINNNDLSREAKWSESVAVGDLVYVEYVQEQLKLVARGRESIPIGDAYQLKERVAAYNTHLTPQKPQLSLENSYYWDDNVY